MNQTVSKPLQILVLFLIAVSPILTGCQWGESSRLAAPRESAGGQLVRADLAQDSVASVTAAITAATRERRQAPPNIIVILADDLGYADVSINHPGRIPTPRINSIGQQGAVFRQGYSSAPICSPSRAALLTGRHQQRYGFEYNPGAAVRELAERRGLDTREVTLADTLRAAGYRTALIGKWHLGGSPEYYPTARGFDEFWGFLTGQTNHIRPDAPEAINAFDPVSGPGAGDLTRAWLNLNPPNRLYMGANRTPVDLGNGLLTEKLTEQAVAFIERNRSRPFFMYLAHHAPHTPLQTTAKYYDRFAHIPNRAQRVYAAMVSALDDAVGGVLDALQAAGIAENTLLVFASDNGCAAYVPGLCSAQPITGGKLTYLEGGVRVPFLMRWPARIPAGTIVDAPVSTLDVFATAMAAAGAPLPADRVYDGADLMPRLKPAASVITSDGSRPLYWRSLPIRAMRDGHWKYLRDYDGNEFLYDLRSDVRETQNRASAEPSQLQTMRQALGQWERDLVPPRWPANVITYEFDGRTFKFSP